MSLRLRLWLGFGLTLLFVLLGLGWFLYTRSAQALADSFFLELKTLTRQYAQLALQADGVKLREAPPSPLVARLGQPEVFLVRSDQTLEDQLGNAKPPVLPAQLWRTLEQGQEVILPLADNRALAGFPIFSSSGQYRLAYVLLLEAQDLSAQTSLAALRQTIVLWSGLALLLAIGLGQWLTTWLLRPIEDISHTASVVLAGNLQARIAQNQRRDELGNLQAHLNLMLARLEQLMVAQRRFTANAAHDLRTPIAVLKTELEVALRRPRSREEYQALLERLLERCQHLGELSEDLLLLSKLEAGLERQQTVNLAETLAGTLQIYQAAAEQRGLEFVLELPPQLFVYGDASAYKQLVANLLSNALRFAKRHFGLRVQKQNEAILLTVWDDGTGVPEALRPHLFEPFQKGNHATGTGLGLAIALEAAKAHGGSLWLEESQTGAVFRAKLPIGLALADSNVRLTHNG